MLSKIKLKNKSNKSLRDEYNILKEKRLDIERSGHNF